MNRRVTVTIDDTDVPIPDERVLSAQEIAEAISDWINVHDDKRRSKRHSVRLIADPFAGSIHARIRRLP